jgi:hypothetical protein
MDARQQDYPQSGLSTPYPTFPEPASEGTSADPASAAQYPPQGPDPRSTNLTPSSDYSLNPSSARSGSFPEYIQRSYQPGAQGQAPGGMAQQQSPSMSIPDGQTNDHHQSPQLKSDSDVPIDPSIAAQTSPTYPSHQQQYSPYTPHHDMQHYPGQPQTPMGYPQRPEWAGHYAQPGMHYGHPATSGPPAPAMVSPVQRPPNVSPPAPPVQTPIQTRQSRIMSRVFFIQVVRCKVCNTNLTRRADIRCPRFIHLFLFRARNNTSARVGDTRRLSACTSAAGTVARRLMAL